MKRLFVLALGLAAALTRVDAQIPLVATRTILQKAERLPAPLAPTLVPTEVWNASSDPRDHSAFVTSAATFGRALWLGTFASGLYRVPLDARGNVPADLAAHTTPVKSPARLINRVVADQKGLYVASNEGVFVSRDGRHFAPLKRITARAITGLALAGPDLWVASSEAVYRLSRAGRILESHVYPAGSHAIQDLSVGRDGVVWLATEDRGVVRLRGQDATAFDRLAALPTSWFTSVAADAEGGAYATSLRHGSVHLASDGTWQPLGWTPDPWGLSAEVEVDEVCVGTQRGARCHGPFVDASFQLPDPRAHVFFRVGGARFVGTEGGLARYEQPAS